MEKLFALNVVKTIFSKKTPASHYKRRKESIIVFYMTHKNSVFNVI